MIATAGKGSSNQAREAAAGAVSDGEQKGLRVLTLFRQIVATAKRHFQSVQKECGISGAQLWALWQISADPGIKVGDLARHMSVHQSTASNLVDRLEAKELVRRERKRSDQRVVRLFCTAAGRSVLDKAPGPARGVLPEAVGQLSDRELQRIETALGTLARRIKMIDKQGGKRPLSELISPRETE